MSSIIVDFRLDRFRNKQGRDVVVYVPIIDLVLHSTHMYTSKISCYLDTGAHYNIFPSEIATSFFGKSEKSLRRGIELPILGIGGYTTTAYGFNVEIIHPYFKFTDEIYFLDNQSFPLLGRKGFMDHFDKIIFNEKERKLELVI